MGLVVTVDHAWETSHIYLTTMRNQFAYHHCQLMLALDTTTTINPEQYQPPA